MEYNIKGNLHRDFAAAADNVLPGRAYFIPFADYEKMMQSNIITERYSSDLVRVLGGEWDFKYYSNENNMPKSFDTSKQEFDSVKVPSVWQSTGYEEPYYVNTRYQFKPSPPEIPSVCPVGVYRKTFNLEEDEAENEFVLTFLGVAGAMEVYFNGEYLGYAECSHNTAEFSLSGKVVPGENELLVVNFKWSTSTYLECQDMFRCNGIFRDVLLTKSESASLWDFSAETMINDDATYDLSINCETKGECSVLAKLCNGEEVVSEQSCDSSNGGCKIEMNALSVQEWSAEIPQLYTLIIAVAQGEKIIQFVKRKIGFKHIKINGNVFTFNNKAIKLMGVNHHDTTSENGYAMSIDEMERDVKIFKQYNVNCVRTSHYPPDPAFLDFCDEYGIYVVDEADIETHGCECELHRPGLISHDPAWRDRYWDRVGRMYQRDKNHPSITMWSLGNEAHGYLNQDYCYEQLKKLTDIPVHYEAVCRTRRWAYDVVSQMYPPLGVVKRLSTGSGLQKKYFTKPYFMCEYAHAMGLGAGELDTYVNAFLCASNMMGGCIWEFCDHAIYHENGKYKYTYGGDHGEEKHDGNFCVDGLFDPERRPHPGAIAMRSCYRPVRAKNEYGKSFSFKNINFFAPIETVVGWTVFGDGKTIGSGEALLKIEPRAKQTVNIDYDDSDVGNCVIVFRYRNADGGDIGCEQMQLSTAKKLNSVKCDSKPFVTKCEKKLIVRFDGGKIVYNTENGLFESYIKDGVEYINCAPFGDCVGFAATVFRAPIDNDMYISKSWNRKGLNTEHMTCISKNKASYAEKDNKIVISNLYRIDSAKKKNIAKAEITVSIYGNGTLMLSLNGISGGVKYLPRFGITLEMPRSFDTVTYFGRGSLANTSDFNSHAMLGEYTCKVDDMHEEYIRPQESSMRSDVTMARVCDSQGRGLEFFAASDAFVFGADHYTSKQCAKVEHIEDLHRCDTTVVHLDAYMLGAGSNACGPRPTQNHKTNKVKDCSLSLIIKPF